MLQDLINLESCRSCAGDDDSGVLLQEMIRSHAGEEKSRVLQKVLQEMTSPDAGGASVVRLGGGVKVGHKTIVLLHKIQTYISNEETNNSLQNK